MNRPDATQSAPIDVRQYIRVLQRKKLLVVAVAGLVILAAIGYLARTPPSYTGRSTVIIKVITSTPFEANVRSDLLVVPATEAKIATSGKVAARAAALMGRPGDQRQVRRNVSVNVPPKSQVLTIQYQGASAKEAAEGANAFAAAYLEHRAADALQDRDKSVAEMTDNVNKLRAELTRTNLALSTQKKGTPAYEDNIAYSDVLRMQISNVRDRQSMLVTMPTDGGELVSEASPPAGPSAPNRTQVLIASVLIGLVLGLVVAFARDRLDPTIRDAAELEEASRLPLLATIPGESALTSRARTLAVVERPYGTAAEAYRRCRAAIAAIHEQGDTGRHVLVLDTGRTNAASEVASNLAASMQRGGHRVVLIVAEAGHGKLYASLGVHRGPGLSEVLKETVSVRRALQGNRLRVLTAGNDEADLPDLVSGDRMRGLLAELSANFDYVIVAAPSTTTRFGTVLEFARSGRIVLVAQQGRSSREAIRNLVAELDLIGAQWDGCVLRGRSSAESRALWQPSISRARRRAPAKRAERPRQDTTSVATSEPAWRASTDADAPADSEVEVRLGRS
jgi:polysaccharide biosynthesis transport protein